MAEAMSASAEEASPFIIVGNLTLEVEDNMVVTVFSCLGEIASLRRVGTVSLHVPGAGGDGTHDFASSGAPQQE